MLDFPYTSDYDDMNIGVSKSTCLGPIIKHLVKEKRVCRRAARNLIRGGHNIRVKLSLMGKLN